MATRWEKGWKQAKTVGGGVALFWRGYVPITLSEADARDLQLAANQLECAPAQIVQAAIRAWLSRWRQGGEASPLAGQTSAMTGKQRVKGTYFHRPRS